MARRAANKRRTTRPSQQVTELPPIPSGARVLSLEDLKRLLPPSPPKTEEERARRRAEFVASITGPGSLIHEMHRLGCAHCGEADFLQQADRLGERLKDPAAMLIGAVLEDALRQLCRKHGIPEGDSIEAMNEPLRKASTYGLPQKQQVTAWATIRNKADHARFNEYTEA